MQFLVDALAKIKPGKHWKTQAGKFQQMIAEQEILFDYPFEDYDAAEYEDQQSNCWHANMAEVIKTAHRSPTFDCVTCKRTLPRKGSGIGTGYTRTEAGEKICYDCTTEQDRQNFAAMKVGDKAILYLHKDSHRQWSVQNWTGQFKINVSIPMMGRHNVAGKRSDIWFKHAGNCFHGVTYGQDAEICHIKCVKPF